MDIDDLRELTRLLRMDAFKSPARLSIMLYLLVKEEAFFTDLVEALGLTPGNLWSHLKRLEEDGFIAIKHVIADRPRVSVRLTNKGYNKIMDLVATMRVLLEHIRVDEK